MAYSVKIKNKLEEIIISKENFTQICRSCLFGNAETHLFEFEYEGNMLSTIYTSLYSVEISKNDGLPSSICQNCVDNIKLFNSFKTTVLNSENILKNICDKEFETRPTQKKDCDFSENADPKPINSPNEQKVEKEELPACCTICNKTVSTDRIARHMKLHSKTGESYQCEICGKKYQTRRNLARHKLSHTGLPHVCELCGRGFRESHLLKEHHNIHSGVHPYLCSLCGKRYPTSSALRLHKRYTHQGIKPKVYRCPKKANTQSKTNRGGGSFPCEICGKVYASRTIVNYHILTHSDEKKFQCNACGKMFANKSILGDHRRIHRMSYKCKFCERTFAYAASLETHLNSHTGAKPHACTLCDKRYSNRSHLREHVRQHTGERPYTCDECGKKFAVRGNLNSHRRTCK